MSYYSFKRRNYGLLSIIFGCLFLVVGVITFFLFDPICFEVLKRVSGLWQNQPHQILFELHIDRIYSSFIDHDVKGKLF